jgi:hypothetical protein
LRNQERNIKISRTHPTLRVYRWDKHLRAKDYQEIEQERKEGDENLQLVEDQNLNLYRVRYSKHDLKKIHSLNSIKNLCLDIES